MFIASHVAHALSASKKRRTAKKQEINTSGNLKGSMISVSVTLNSTIRPFDFALALGALENNRIVGIIRLHLGVTIGTFHSLLLPPVWGAEPRRSPIARFVRRNMTEQGIAFLEVDATSARFTFRKTHVYVSRLSLHWFVSHALGLLAPHSGHSFNFPTVISGTPPSTKTKSS